MIDPKTWARTEELFNQAVELAEEEREEFLTRNCGGDKELKQRVLDLLAADDSAEGFLQTPAARIDPEQAPLTSDSIGPYDVVRPLGGGGMGDVYLGREAGADFERYVAVKVLKDRGFSERFAQERAILAQLTHPGIAQFLGAGQTEDGRLYYAMEHVRGDRITAVADRSTLTVRERVELMRQVCMIVQYAHGNLVVHRDLKPSNILVADDGIPKLLDFGIAKILAGSEDPTHALTGTGHHLATPLYAAPEQIRGDVVGTAADVYSLGVLLYELLTGHRPFSATEAVGRAGQPAPPSPTPPSSVVSTTGSRILPNGDEKPVTPETVSRKRRTDPGTLRRSLRGDVDNIVLKAMDHRPERRYVSAAALADDLERFLAGHPVAARGDSVGYRFAKLVRRNKLTSGTTAALVVTMIAATLGTLAQNREIRDQSERLAVERDRALEVQSFLLESLGGAGAESTRGEPVTVREVLDARGNQIDQLYSETPATRAEVLHVMAEGYQRLGELEEAQDFGEQAVAARIALNEDQPNQDLARSQVVLGWILYERGELDEAEALIREALETWRSIETDSAGLSRALNDLSGVLYGQQRFEESEQLALEALNIRRALYSGAHQSIAVTANNLGNTLASLGRHEEALGYLEESAEVLGTVFGANHRRTLMARRNVGLVLTHLGRFEEAVVESQAVVDAFLAMERVDDFRLAQAYLGLGTSTAQLGRNEEADSIFGLGFALAQEQLGDHELTGFILGQRAAMAQRMGDRQLALERTRERIAMYGRIYDDHPDFASALQRLGSWATDRTEQLAAFQQATEMYRRLEGETGPRAVRVNLSWARALLAADRTEAALDHFLQLAEWIPEAYGDDHPYSPAPYLGQAQTYATIGDMERATEALAEARRRLVGAADVPPNQQWLSQVEALIP